VSLRSEAAKHGDLRLRLAGCSSPAKHGESAIGKRRHHGLCSASVAISGTRRTGSSCTSDTNMLDVGSDGEGEVHIEVRYLLVPYVLIYPQHVYPAVSTATTLPGSVTVPLTGASNPPAVLTYNTSLSFFVLPKAAAVPPATVN
jgi:hypothetical protein